MALRFTLRQLEYFVAVGEAGSIVQAAEKVSVSPPSISASISQLEDEFGIQLFVRRHSHGLSLTAGGRQFFKQAKRLLEDADALHDLAGDIAHSVRGPLDIGCLLTFAQLVLPELRRRFEAAWPEVRVRQFERHQAELLEMLQRAELDVALTYDLEIPQDISFEPLLSLSPYVLLPRRHPLASRTSIAIEELVEEPMVLLDLPLSRDYFLSLFQRCGLRPRIAERTSDISVMRSMVANGFGYALANVRPRSKVSPDGKSVSQVRLEGDFRPMIMGLATTASERKTRTVEAFVAHCRASVGSGRVPGLATGEEPA